MQKLILLIALICCFSANAYASCTLSVPDQVHNHPGIGLSGDYMGITTTTATVTCPAGQSWTLTAPANYQIYNGSAYLYYWSCSAGHSSDCNSYNGSGVASGTGTGTAQTVNIYAKYTFQYAPTNYVNATYQFKIQNYASPITYTLTGDTTVTASPVINDNLVQACKIVSTTNWTAAYTGAAAVTGSFGTTYMCGYGTTPNVSLSVSGGNNPSGETRRAHKTGGYIGYHLFWDAAYTSEIGVTTNKSTSINVATATSGSSFGTQTIYAKILKTDPLTTASTNGAYTDVVTISLDF